MAPVLGRCKVKSHRVVRGGCMEVNAMNNLDSLPALYDFYE